MTTAPTVSPSEEDASTSLIAARLHIGYFIAAAFVILTLVTVACVGLVGWIILGDLASTNPTATMGFVASIQVVYGMTTGYICIVMGLLMSWFGIEAAYSLSASASSEKNKGDVALKSASPGLLFALGGLILVGVSLYKPVVYQETGSQLRRLGNPPAGVEGKVTPGNLPAINKDSVTEWDDRNK